MKRLLPSGVTGLAIGAVAVAISASALAFFSPSGAGTASAGVSKLTAPTITAITPAVGGTVSLAWSAATPPDSATAVKYYVTRDGGDPGGTCAAPAVPAAATSCKDSGVPVGTHTYTVTAVWRSWTVTSGVQTAKITVGEADHFTVTATTTTPGVGVSTNLTITAKDENESTVTTYTGSHSLVFSGAASSPGGTAPTVVNSSGTATAFGKTTALTFTSGVAAVSSSRNGVLKVYKSGPAEVVATEGTITTTAPLELELISGTQTKYNLTAATTTPVAGARTDLTITAVDTYGNNAAAYTGMHELVFSTAASSVGPNGDLPTVSDSGGEDVAFGTATEIEFIAGVATTKGSANGEMVLYKTGSTAITATEGSLKNTTALTVTVAAGSAVNFVLAASTTTPVAAASFNLTTTAKDVYGNNATGYTGSKNLTFGGATASPAGTMPTVVNSSGTQVNFGTATAITFSSGVASVSSSKNGLARLYLAGASNLTVTDGTISTAAPLAVTVAVGTAARWALTAVEKSAGTFTSTCLWTCPITGLGNSGVVSANVSVTDSAGNTVSNLGTGHSVKISATTGGTVVGTPLTIADTGLAVSTARFTYTAPSNGNFSHTITAATNAGTAYTSATATVSK
jgi:hypothetical protein